MGLEGQSMSGSSSSFAWLLYAWHCPVLWNLSRIPVEINEVACLKTKAGKPFLCGIILVLPQCNNNLPWLKSHLRRTFLLLFLLPGLLMAKAQVLAASEPRFSYTISALRDEALRQTKDPTATAQLHGQQLPCRRADASATTDLSNQKPAVPVQCQYPGRHCPVLFAGVKKKKSQNQLHWPCLCMGEGLHPECNAWSPTMALDATRSTRQAWYRQESVSYLPHGPTCHNAVKLHIRACSSTHIHNMRWDSFKFSSTAMLLL